MNRKKGFSVILLVTVICILFSATAYAEVKKPVQKLTVRWTKKNGYDYCYVNGKKQKNGIFEIDGKSYYFDKKGRQRTGWRKIKKKIYFFKNSRGKKGYMVKGKKVDGIKINKSGHAVPKTKRAKMKLPILLKCRKIVDELTNPGMTDRQKQRKCFDYVNTYFNSNYVPDLSREANWDLVYTDKMLEYGYGDCYSHAVTFAYLAHAAGSKNVSCIHNGGHCWAKIGNRYYDPHWERCTEVPCFAVPKSGCGKYGRPNWPGESPKYIKKCNK